MDHTSDIKATIERNRLSDWPDLDDSQKAFCFEYVANGYNIAESCEHVGRTYSYGKKLLRDPLASAFVRHLQEQRFQHHIITKDFVEQQYLRLIPMLMGDEEVHMVVGDRGINIRAKKFFPSEAASVLRDLSKSSGYMGPQEVKVSGFDDLISAIASITKDNQM